MEFFVTIKKIDKLSQNKFHNFSKHCCLFKGVNIIFNAYIFAFVLHLLAVYGGITWWCVLTLSVVT